MLEAPPHLQRALDEAFPGMRLEFNERMGYWVLTDDIFWIDGSVCYTANYPCPGGMRGIEHYPNTRRALIWVLGNPHTFERWEPCADLILNALYRAHNGGRIDGINEFIDQIEAGEDASEAREKLAKRNRARDVGGDVFDRVVRGRSVFGADAGVTPWKRAQEDRRAEEKKAEDEAFADEEAAKLIRDGRYGYAGKTMLGSG